MNWDILKRILIQMWQTAFGQTGTNVTVANTSPVTTSANNCYTALQVLSATAVISAITIDGASDAGIIAVASYPQGMIIYGRITALTLTSGTVRLYGGNNALLA
jgi:hypothetical protein